MLWSQSTTKDYTRAEHKLQFISKSFSPQVITLQVIIPQVFLSQTTAQILSTILGRKTRKTIKKCFGAYLHSVSTQHRNLHPAGWPIFFCGPTQLALAIMITDVAHTFSIPSNEKTFLFVCYFFRYQLLWQNMPESLCHNKTTRTKQQEQKPKTKQRTRPVKLNVFFFFNRKTHAFITWHTDIINIIQLHVLLITFLDHLSISQSF